MKAKLTCVALLFALAGLLAAAPLTFNEVSLLVRMRETDTYVLQQLSERRLLRVLTPEQEAKLNAEGASPALLQALRDPATILSGAEAVTFETWKEEQRIAVEKAIAAEAAERAEREAARAVALAAWNREQEEKAALARAEAMAAAQYSEAPYASYGGAYGCGPYSSYGRNSACPGRIISSPRSLGCPPNGSISGGALQWQNGSTTIHASPGISYYPLGTNGSGTFSAGQICVGTSGHGSGGGGGGRFGR